MISALTWIRQGKAKSDPTPTSLTEAELENAVKELGWNLTNAKLKTDQAEADQELKQYNLSDYESEEEDSSLFTHMKGLSYYPSNDQDPYLKLDDQENKQESKILDTDHLIVMAKTLDDMSHLEVYVYEKEEENLYVHHDILLPSFPLAVEWLDYGKNGAQGNLIAVSTFDPEIEIWDLDCLEVMLPTVVLGSSSGKKKKKMVHTDAVMSLSWNSNSRNHIASGSADHTIKIWDINNPKTSIQSFQKHSNKVSDLQWHPSSSSVLLSGGFDARACVFDIRTPDSNTDIFKLDSDVESLKWDPLNLSRFMVSTEGGFLYCFDARNSSESVFKIHAHDGAVSSLDISQVLPGCILTASSEDKLVKIWSIKNDQPVCLTSRDLEIGRLFSAQLSVDAPYHAAIGGSTGKMAVWNFESNASIQSNYPSKFEKTHRTLLFTEGDDESDMEDDSEDDAIVEDEI